MTEEEEALELEKQQQKEDLIRREMEEIENEKNRVYQDKAVIENVLQEKELKLKQE